LVFGMISSEKEVSMKRLVVGRLKRVAIKRVVAGKAKKLIRCAGECKKKAKLGK